MAVSVEVYFLTNFLMDFAATAIVARSLGRVRWRRVMLAAALGAVWATLAQLPLLRFLASFGGAAAMAFVLAAVAMPPDCLRSALRAGAALLGGALFLGGVQLAAVRGRRRSSPGRCWARWRCWRRPGRGKSGW